MVRIGVVGAGYWGPNIVRNLHRMAGAEIAGVCDLSRPALDKIHENFPDIPLYASFDEMVTEGRPDAAVIVTPAATHANLAYQALNRGLHVLVEKPLATRSSDAKALIDLADRNGRVLMAGHTFLYSNYVRTAKRLLDEGALGKLLHLYSQRLNLGQIRSDVDVLWNIGPHDISILNFLTGEMPESVSAWGVTMLDHGHEFPDVVFGRLDYPGSITAHIHLSWLDPLKVRRMVLVGTEKMLVYDDTDAKTPIQIHDKSAVRDRNGRFTIRSGTVTALAVDLPEPLGMELAHFISCIETGKPSLTGGRHALGVITVLEALSDSLARGGAQVPVQIPESTEVVRR
jgi:predicted dehydrogenase